jgi:hypothetical protein
MNLLNLTRLFPIFSDASKGAEGLSVSFSSFSIGVLRLEDGSLADLFA